MTNPPLISMRGVTFAYRLPPRRGGEGATVTAVDNVDLDLWPGAYVAVLGHNGSGKSTLARLCNALLIPTEGQVVVGGCDTRNPANWRGIRETVGMVFQNPDNQIIATVVQDDIAWGLAMRGVPAEAIRARVSEALDAVDLTNQRDWAPHHLSGGQRQRLAIASVVALRPRCIVVDEPTAQLDPVARREVVALLHRLNRDDGVAIVQVTHAIDEAALASRIVIVERGHIVVDGSPYDVLGDLDRLRRLGIAVTDPLELAARLRSLGRVIAPDALTAETIAQEIAR